MTEPQPTANTQTGADTPSSLSALSALSVGERAGRAASFRGGRWHNAVCRRCPHTREARDYARACTTQIWDDRDAADYRPHASCGYLPVSSLTSSCNTRAARCQRSEDGGFCDCTFCIASMPLRSSSRFIACSPQRSSSSRRFHHNRTRAPWSAGWADGQRKASEDRIFCLGHSAWRKGRQRSSVRLERGSSSPDPQCAFAMKDI